MGYGDQLMATGMARGAAARGKRIAFGDRRTIRWDSRSAEIFRGNPNIAPPGAERDRDIEWIEYFKGHRLYNRQAGPRWIWNMAFRPTPGELVFDRVERRNAARAGKGFVVIEPDLDRHKTSAPNKDWGLSSYQSVADELAAAGHRIVQFTHPGTESQLVGVNQVRTMSFRDAAALLGQASLFIGPEGGMHHAAAAVGIPAVVLFGGFIPPAVTGYPGHTNLTGGAEACGSLSPCAHCRAALDAIAPADVVTAAAPYLQGT